MTTTIYMLILAYGGAPNIGSLIQVYENRPACLAGVEQYAERARDKGDRVEFELSRKLVCVYFPFPTKPTT